MRDLTQCIPTLWGAFFALFRSISTYEHQIKKIAGFLFSLDQAHYHGRRADSHLRHLRFDDAIESHRKAAAALDEALQSPPNSNSKMLESIKLQRDFHMKHIELVRLKKVQHEKLKMAVEQQRIKNVDLLEQRAAKERLVDVCDLQIAIFKALEDTDSLLDTLNGSMKRANLSADASDTSNTDHDDTKKSDDENQSNGDATIDEMHRLNTQIHVLVYNLVHRVDESTQEMEALRDRIKILEKERSQSRQVSLGASNKSSSESIRTDESPTLSDCNDTRRNSVSGEERKIVLPESSDLPPLELPEFDYNI